MPKFKIKVSEITYFEGTVEAENREDLEKMDLEEMGLSKIDKAPMRIIYVNSEHE